MANQVETEQLVQIRGTEGGLTASFVQLRGSIPLMWSQIPNIKYKPATQVAPLEDSERAFDNHVKGLLQSYEVIFKALIWNLQSSLTSLIWQRARMFSEKRCACSS